MGWFCTQLFIVCVTVAFSDGDCHCDTTAACAVFPSTPCSQVGDPDRCQEGWFGPYCQKHEYGAALGVDGRATTNATSFPRTCAHTLQESNPTWTVNLNTSVPERIHHIRLYIRDKFLERSNGMEIFVGSQMCYNWSSTEHPPPIANVTCRQPLTGTTVTIRIPGQQKFLTLCEVQIYVCSNGWFSEDCDKQCRCFNSTEICDKITGHCSSGCLPGSLGPDCQTACPNGTYGINCSSQCGNCLDGVSCDKTNGKCSAGCATGYIRDDTCLQENVTETHGINCSSECGCKACNTYGEECSNWGIPVTVILVVLLICTITGATIYIRRLLKRLENLETKIRKEHYVALDEKTKTTATESAYEDIENATPYYNTVNNLQDETGSEDKGSRDRK